MVWSRVFRNGEKIAEIESPTKAEIFVKALIREVGGTCALLMPLGNAFVVQLYRESLNGRTGPRQVGNETYGNLREATAAAKYSSREGSDSEV